MNREVEPKYIQEDKPVSLLEQLVQEYAAADLEPIFTKVGIKADKIPADNRQHLGISLIPGDSICCF
jgi:hypothetical protein